MSLRDQLLSKGLVKKADVRRAEQEAKRERKAEQGAKARKRILEQERKAAEQAEEQARQAQRLEDRKRAESQRDRHERALQVRNLILGHRMNNRGEQPFWYRGPDGRTVFRLKVHPRIAAELAAGNLAIARLDQGNRDEHVLIGKVGAEKLEAIGATEVLLHWAKDLPRDEADGLLQRDWEPSIRPHRVR